MKAKAKSKKVTPIKGALLSKARKMGFSKDMPKKPATSKQTIANLKAYKKKVTEYNSALNKKAREYDTLKTLQKTT